MTQDARKHGVWKMLSVHELHCGAHDDQECGGNFQRNPLKSSTVKDESGSREACLLSSKMWPLSHRVTSPHSFSLVLIQKRLFGSLLTLLLWRLPKDTQPLNTLYILESTRTHTVGNVRNNLIKTFSFRLWIWEVGCMHGRSSREERKGRNSVVVFWFLKN